MPFPRNGGESRGQHSEELIKDIEKEMRLLEERLIRIEPCMDSENLVQDSLLIWMKS